MNKFNFKSICLFAIWCFFSTSISAQLWRSNNYWKQYRKELWVNFGASNFLGELGGRDRVGSDFIYDLEISQTKFATALGYRYFINKNLALTGAIHYGMLSGDDKLTKEVFRQNRNLNFKSPILESGLQFEYHFATQGVGHRYNLRGRTGGKTHRLDAMKWSLHGFYLFAGISGVYFNPKGNYNGSWIPLRPLSTEGQGLDGGPKPYRRISIAIPSGAGYRFSVSRRWLGEVNISWRKTFTDYIDDVSGVYYNNDSILAAKGPVAAYMADPNLGYSSNPDIPVTAPGQQRGDATDKDAYMFLYLGIIRKLSPKSGNGRWHKGLGRRRVRASF